MKRFIGIIVVVTLFLNASAQIMAYDTVTTSSENKDMTFYNLQTGEKTVTANNDWHIAVSVRPSLFPSNTLQGTTIRINEAFGVKVYQIPGFKADSFSIWVDTTGFRSLPRFNDSDSLLDLGALNKGLNIGVYNYGWGVYSGPPDHNVIGNKVYLFELPGGQVKKLLVYQLDRDTAWDLKIANIDNANLQIVHVAKKDYPGKNFVYLNLLDNNVMDKEPLSTTWDLQFLKYAATDIQPGNTAPIVGVWSNKGTKAARRSGEDIASNDYSNVTFSLAMNTIGWDWKYLVSNQEYLSGKTDSYLDRFYRVEDSLAYFINTLSGDIYKIVFTGYGGSANGIITFYKEKIHLSAVHEAGNENVLDVFPNPCNSILNVSLRTPSMVKVYDQSGRIVEEQFTSGKTLSFSTSRFADGIYLLAINTNGNSYIKKFIVHHYN